MPNVKFKTTKSHLIFKLPIIYEIQSPIENIPNLDLIESVFLSVQELADLKDRIAKETAEAEAKKSSEGPAKIDEKNASEAKSALEAAMAATLAEYAPPSAPSPSSCIS